VKTKAENLLRTQDYVDRTEPSGTILGRVHGGEMTWRRRRDCRFVFVLVLATLGFERLPSAQAQTTVDRYGVFELSLETTESFENPFTDAHLTAEFQSPDGRKLAVPGFYYGGTTWMVRFVPDQVGQWSFRAKLAGKRTAVDRSGSFRCTSSTRHGFLRISKRNPYRLEFDDATPFYPVGVQNCGYPQTGMDGPNEDGSWRTVPAETWAQEFDGAANLIRWQLGAGTKAGCALPLIPVGGPPDRYDTNLAKNMDELLVMQRAHGFSHIMILFQDMSLWGKDVTAFGRVDDLGSYKSLKAANLSLQEQYVRYVVARFGCFVDIWELFNEDSYAPNDYLARLAAVVREADPYRHPVTTNYARPAEPWCEIVTWHAYMRTPAERVGRWIAAQVGQYKSYGKPVLNTEFGNSRAFSNFDPIKWRVALWTAYMNESNVLFWNMSGRRTEPGVGGGNSNAYLGPDSRRHFRVFREFTRELPVDLRPVECSYHQHNDLDVYALSNHNVSVLYVNHFADYSRPYASKGRIYVRTGPGKFRLTWIDPVDGRVVRTDRSETTQQYLFFEMPPVTIDLACRADREN
jgi:hypothetical protein